jgi:hypothetical protein
MKKIPLSGINGQGKYALVDDEDFDRVSQLRWCIDNHGYAGRSVHRPKTHPNGKRGVSRLKLHHFVLGSKPGQHVDHENRNRLDCRRSNLRPSTHAENNQNTGTTRRNVSGFKGVSWHSGARRWRCTIKPAGSKQIQLGFFDDPEQAALVYDAAAIQFFGDFAYLNIVGRS